MAGFAFTELHEPSARAEHGGLIALVWLARLRWLAVGGQIAAAVTAVRGLGLELPLAPIAWIIFLTAISNFYLVHRLHRCSPSRWLVPAVVILDVCLLSGLLYFTGGSSNPFTALYLVHVAMAVAILPPIWTWAVVALVVAAHSLLMFWNVPLSPRTDPTPWILASGQWTSLALVASLIAYFAGRVQRSLRLREAELAKARELAGRNERLVALTALAAGAAHELGTPLATIAVVAKELELACHSESASSLVADARLIRQEVERCRTILGRMRVDVVRQSEIDGSMSTAELLREVRSELKKGQSQRLRVENRRDFEMSAAAGAGIEQSLVVLLRNAFDADPSGSPVRLAISAENGMARFEVEDHGRGMDEQSLHRAGDPFFTTKPPGSGMGLGLFLVRLVAEKHGGSLRLVSRPGVGTRCVLELPLGNVQRSNESEHEQLAGENARRR